MSKTRRDEPSSAPTAIGGEKNDPLNDMYVPVGNNKNRNDEEEKKVEAKDKGEQERERETEEIT